MELRSRFAHPPSLPAPRYSPLKMMHRYGDNWLKLVKRERVIAVIRSTDLSIGREMARAVAAGGIKLIEITANSDRPWALIELLRAELPDCSIGTGTILSLADVRNAIACGAEYIFTPHFDLSLVRAAINAQIPIVPGALTPTEIITAWQAGATAVKVFPIQAVGGVKYLQVLQGPIGQIPLIPTGGVTESNAPEFLAAGAVAVGLSGCLFPPAEVLQKDWQSIRDRASNLFMRIKVV
ncbi:bifunctional 4-hydroxy-2-oxoglutarate aldolase/2-dehydro-3-deoxy-phosphogluconate aldolase [Chamaesiphon minutus]|uniref:Entner-Doudoroff aldolase n=1 Tax=Chamaesiphon minutus (strain ATCC 27169 / PCC 6605) TaxID=1173020 RepID=K9UHP9_CHAP6|nr:bifunctional 4-hydroxy-2-oxoglutarate aldolase/2-dehydro-3-deoxy-phosphogluconate aldolase [Chamaesiphon minutus]AFY94315.1 Entner-Doudoroff aldolase [Chamaesiphon minutus PCC 6605]